jgi:hypothetical protein
MKNKIFYMFLLLCFSARIFGQVGINTSTPNTKSALDVVSKNNNTGILIPRLTTAQRDAIGVASTEDGLTIYNTDEKCYNYYQSTNATWLSLCGTYQKAVYTTDCTNIKVFGTYTQGTSLNTSNYITIPITVTKAGTYSIIAKTTNGYYFEKSGVFPNTGTFTITLDGSGAPVAGPQTDTLSFIYEGVTDTTCTSKTISVLGSQVSYTINCGSAVVNGTYMQGESLDASNYVTIPLSGVTTGGTVTIATGTNNGVTFSTTETITTSSTSITLKGQGIPTSAGTYTYTFITNGATPVTCSFNVKFDTTVGTFANPADRCYQILQADASKTDGEYWIKTSSSDATPVKTLCDMTNGGYTLLWSFSERTAYVSPADLYGNAANNMEIFSGDASRFTQNRPRNVVTANGSNIAGTNLGLYNDYRLSLATMQNVRTANPGDYRVRITVSPTDMSDNWGVNNFFRIKPTSGYDYIANSNSTCAESNVPAVGKLFGRAYNGSTNTPTYNGVNVNGDICPYVGTGYGNHFDAGLRIANNPTNYTVIPGGQTFNANSFNDLFGFFGETEINHHFGKCGAGSDDFLFTPNSCSSSQLVPHSFNSGEGRVLQWFVK